MGSFPSVITTDSRANAFGTFLWLIRVPILNNFQN